MRKQKELGIVALTNPVGSENLAIRQENEPSELIRLAIDKGADLEKLKQLLDIKRAYDADKARKAYHLAMSEFKANPPSIGKDKKVGYKTKDGGGVGYSHASLYNVTEKINKELSKYGLSASWTTKQNGAISVTCRITHCMGHSEETTLTAPADTSGSKNAIQAIGSTISYLCRYTLLCLTGLATRDQDDDGRASQEPIKQSQPIKEVDAKPEDKSPTPIAMMLDSFAKAKKVLGEKEYYKILGNNGFEKSNQIPKVAEGNKILEIMRKRVMELKA